LIIVTVVRNDLAGLCRTITSILSKDLQGAVKKILIVDGHSTDGSLTYARQLALECDEVDLLSAPPKGIYDAMNQALEHLAMNTELDDEAVLFLNAGDYLMDGEVLKRLARMTHLSRWATGHATLIRFGDFPHYVTPELSYENTMKPNPHDFWIPHQALLTKLSDFRRVGFFNLNYRIASDYDFMCRFWEAFGPPLVLNEVVSCQVLNGMSNIKTHSAHREKNEVASNFGFSQVNLDTRTAFKWWLKENLLTRFQFANSEIRNEARVVQQLRVKSCHDEFMKSCPWCNFLKLLNFGKIYNWVE
jgi:glycosyltransferase involved in cell wall biosynthesis